MYFPNEILIKIFSHAQNKFIFEVNRNFRRLYYLCYVPDKYNSRFNFLIEHKEIKLCKLNLKNPNVDVNEGNLRRFKDNKWINNKSPICNILNSKFDIQNKFKIFCETNCLDRR